MERSTAWRISGTVLKRMPWSGSFILGISQSKSQGLKPLWLRLLKFQPSYVDTDGKSFLLLSSEKPEKRERLFNGPGWTTLCKNCFFLIEQVQTWRRYKTLWWDDIWQLYGMRKANMKLFLWVGSEVWLLVLLIVRSRRRWVFIFVPRPRYHQENSLITLWTGGWVGPHSGEQGRVQTHPSISFVVPPWSSLTEQTTLSLKHRENPCSNNKFFSDVQWNGIWCMCDLRHLW